MLISLAKTIIANKLKLKGEVKTPDDASLAIVLDEALLFLANKVVPKELLRSAEDISDVSLVLRLIEQGNFITKPTPVDITSTTLHLNIDEELSYAVIAKACALIAQEPKNIGIFENEMDKIVNTYKTNFNRVMQ